MSGILPISPHFFTPETDDSPVCEWVMPAVIPRQQYARTCSALPPGMPSCLEVCVTHTEEGMERTTAAIYGTRAYLIHYAFTPHRR